MNTTTINYDLLDADLLLTIAAHPETTADALVELSGLVRGLPLLGKAILAHPNCSGAAVSAVLASHIEAASAAQPSTQEPVKTPDTKEQNAVGTEVVIKPAATSKKTQKRTTTKPAPKPRRGGRKSTVTANQLAKATTSVIKEDAAAQELVEKARKSTSSAVLRELLTQERLDIKMAALRNIYCGLRSLREYAENSNPALRERVASNPRCPADVLEALVKDKSAKVRRAVLTNRNATTDVLLAAAKGNDTDLHYYAARHKNADAEVLSVLAEYKNDVEVSREAQERLTLVAA